MPFNEDKLTVSSPTALLSPSFSTPLHELAEHAAKSAHFPKVSTLATVMGVYSNMLVNRGVTVEHDGVKFPAGLYMVVTGEPGTGKSLILNIAGRAAKSAYREINAKRATARRIAGRQIALIESQIAELDPFEKVEELEELESLLAGLVAEKQANCELILGLSDATPAATNQLALSSGGVVNYCSAEPDLFHNLFNSSGDKGADKSMLLHGFDGGETCTYRITRKGYRGVVTSGLICMAQPSALHELIKDQNDGRGVIERFLLVDEPQPPRVLTNQHEIPAAVLARWEQLARHTAGIYPLGTFTSPISLKMTKEDDLKVILVAQEVENQSHPGGRFSSSLMKSAGRKCRIQIAKLAAVLYMAKTQGDAPTPANDKPEQRVISSDCVTAAIAYWWGFIGMFEAIATDTETGGQAAVTEALRKMLIRKLAANKAYSLRDFVQDVSRQRPGHILKGYGRNEAMIGLLTQAEGLGWISRRGEEYLVSKRLD